MTSPPFEKDVVEAARKISQEACEEARLQWHESSSDEIMQVWATGHAGAWASVNHMAAPGALDRLRKP